MGGYIIKAQNIITRHRDVRGNLEMRKFILKNMRTLFKNKIFLISICSLLIFFVVQYLLFANGLIKAKVYSVNIKAQTSFINKNETTKIIARVFSVPFYATNNIIYSSENPAVAKVADDGTITGVSEGETKIIAKLNEAVAQANISVSSKTLLPFAKGKYLGDIIASKRDGYGTMYYENENVYEGFWKDDLINGYGVMVWKNKNKYEGTWKNEQLDGFGKLYRVNEYTYIGGFSNGQFNGYGEIVWQSGNSYKGYWANGQYEGYGVFIWNRTDQYAGAWKNGLKNGYGEYTYNRNQNKYSGNWVDNLRDGYGVEIRDNVIYYEGYWKNDLLNGFGKLYKDGTLDFVGNFVDDKPF